MIANGKALTKKRSKYFVPGNIGEPPVQRSDADTGSIVNPDPAVNGRPFPFSSRVSTPGLQ
jgi:hypothetical protein